MDAAILKLDVDFDASQMADKYRDVRVTIMRITPSVAKELLLRNTRNRRLNKKHHEHLQRIMKMGDWFMNGEAIIFAKDDSLLNGQHRLTACVLSGVSFDSLVVYGIDEDAFKTLDGGRKRQVGELLAMQGEKDANSVASCVSALMSFVATGGNVTGTTYGSSATAQVCDRVLQAHPGIRESVTAVRGQKLYSTQWAYMLHYLFSIVDTRVAGEFAEVLAHGSRDQGRPFNLFREYVIREAGNNRNVRTRAAKAIKAFNAEISGDRPKMLKFRDGKDGDDFPTISGLDYERLADSVA